MQQIRAIEAEQKQVSDYTRWIALRVNRTFDDAKQALLRAAAGSKEDCSPEHITQMGQIVLDAHSIQDIGYFRNGKLACSSLGIFSTPLPARSADMDLGEGYFLTFAVEPKPFRGKPLIELRHGNYGVLIRPGRLIDLVTDRSMTLGVGTDQGRVLQLSGTTDPQLIQRLLSRQSAGVDDRYIFASRRMADFVTFAIISRDQALSATNGWKDILPLSLAISLALIGIVIWVSRQQLSPEKIFELAIQKREFVIHYQPIVELLTGRCIAAEALVRRRQRDGMIINPDLFIPLAEATGLISQLTDLVIEIVMEEMGSLLRSEERFHVSINIPAGGMESGRFLPRLAAAVSKAGVRPSQVWLEVTERGFINATAATDAIKAARTAGYQIAIDDFGTGYSSLSLLQELPLDALKIDKSFVDAIGRDAAKSVVIPHIISMAHELNLSMIAEGIETPEQEAYLKDADVQFGQGWFFSKALPLRQFQAFYRQNRMSDSGNRNETGCPPRTARIRRQSS
jgi:sensor c-di-GMP phosphodiesterase-like protein